VAASSASAWATIGYRGECLRRGGRALQFTSDSTACGRSEIIRPALREALTSYNRIGRPGGGAGRGQLGSPRRVRRARFIGGNGVYAWLQPTATRQGSRMYPRVAQCGPGIRPRVCNSAASGLGALRTRFAAPTVATEMRVPRTRQADLADGPRRGGGEAVRRRTEFEPNG